MSVLTIIGVIAIAALWVYGRRRELRTPPAGSTRVRTISPAWADYTIRRYARAGWVLTGPAVRSKSALRSAKVTLTFKKGPA